MTDSSFCALVPAFAGLGAVAPARAQMTESELVMRLNRLENQVRQLTGQVEQLQYRNSSSSSNSRARRRAAAAAAAAPTAARRRRSRNTRRRRSSLSAAASLPAASLPAAGLSAQQDAYPPGPPPAGGRRGDAFDPNQNPNAPGVPRTLGGAARSRPRRRSTIRRATSRRTSARPAAARPARRSISASWPRKPRTPPPRAARCARFPARCRLRRRAIRAAPGQQMVMAPPNTPKDEYDLAYGYVLRKDYALAEEAARVPEEISGRPAGGGRELLARRKPVPAPALSRGRRDLPRRVDQVREAAKAPDSLLRLGQSLAALEGEGSRLRDLRRNSAQISARVART